MLDAKWIASVTYGRMAIAHALRNMGIRPGDEVLLPAYHCLAMVDPVRWTGAKPVFYEVQDDTMVDLAALEARVTPRTRAVMVTHYFGFPQRIAALRAFCDQRGFTLLEDCAHAFLGESDGARLGSFGDYTIASPPKFFPVHEGGVLTSDRHSLERIHLRSLGWMFDAKAVVVLLERAQRHRRFPPLGTLLGIPLWLKDRAVGVLKALRGGRRGAGLAPEVGGQSAGQEGEFDPQWLDREMSPTSRWIVRHTSRDRMAEARRWNYQQMLEALSGLPGSRPLFPDLPRGVVPFVFPLIVERADAVAESLRRQGLPITRFGEYLDPEVNLADFPATHRLSRTVLQFPCHQELTRRELEWMIETIRAALVAAGPGVKA